ncbi:DUF4435 domain-containing protein [Acinetobacter baumannii]|uniref:DUF4435 domain-containing protein n=1 Tax=Acinetobacter calcoaceticus/baumannii complex TaxID=909768 RepID=UPI001F1C2168|nr:MULTISPECIES: DUF4435 domain-containing protein [Acinetobacter calcoaceticus/baumannii complex]MCF1297979.1 DUF4435 domain-containing protein [Acinetobacter nosocomialis]MDH2565483.1 DUF4435 domain-containing protein [Acinetobacter baumannii]MDQ8923399.1 DUF4435 domain-containing protein [Acinetobacter baumannii]MDQ8926799.1 DUF4435 domain-containing protein [Acinetobacter baumannii]MDQ8933722.1 DUF4435 domain-containing protein [Acinetobacter baumannii]
MSQFTSMMLSEAYLKVYTKNKAIIFTEDQDDIFFWKNIFKNKGEGYKIFPIVSAGSANGKPELLKLMGSLHKHLFVALDSDLNYICKIYQEDLHNKFLSNPFVFQTYTYSKESYEYDILKINQYLSCIYYTQDIKSFFDVFIKDFLDICFKVVIYISYMLDSGITFNRSELEDCLKFKDTDFFFVNDAFQNLASINLIKLNSIFDNKYSEIIDISSEEYKKHISYLDSIGLNNSNAYKFINGHILEKALSKFLEDYKNLVKKKELEYVKSIYNEGQPRVQEIQKVINHFEKNCSISTLIKRSEINSNCPFVQRIFSDLSYV